MRIWFIFPVLVVLVLAAMGGYWKYHNPQWEPPTARLPDISAPVPLPAPQPTTMEQSLERPLLWSSRRVRPSEPQQGRDTQELQQSRLTAVFQTSNAWVAVIQKPNGSISRLTSNSHPWRVVGFDGRHIELGGPDEARIQLMLIPHTPPASPANNRSTSP